MTQKRQRQIEKTVLPLLLVFCMEWDLEIAKRIGSGDKAAFRELFETYNSGILNLCYAMVRNQSDAEDLAQEVFVEVFCSIASYKGQSKLSTWIYRIAVNKSLNHIKKQKLRHLFLSSESKSQQDTTPRGADWDLRDYQYKEYFDKALSALPNKQRTAFVLFMYEQMPQKEIANVMKCSPNAVEVLVHRARKSIESYIEKLDKGILK